MRGFPAARLLGCLAVALAGCLPGPGEASREPPSRSTEGAGRDGTPEAFSLLGAPLFPPEPPPEVRARLEADLEGARADFRKDPEAEERFIWLGRRLAYLGRYRDALAVYTKGIARHPESFRLLRHRGHRLITLRRFDEAIADLSRAAGLIEGIPDEVEPDGAPNPSNIPRSTSHSNIWYHLGLAHYLAHDFELAAQAYRSCMRFAGVNDDMLCATSHWLYMTLRRLGRDEEAGELLLPIRTEMEILESFAYHRLLLLYKGQLVPEEVLLDAGGDGVNFATLAYGVGNRYLVQGSLERAQEIFREITAGSAWAAFGHIAAEAELARLSASPGAPRR